MTSLFLPGERNVVVVSPDLAKFTTRNLSAPLGYTLWEFTGVDWALRKDVSLAGGTPGKPPRVPGHFPGQIRAVPSIAQ